MAEPHRLERIGAVGAMEPGCQRGKIGEGSVRHDLAAVYLTG